MERSVKIDAQRDPNVLLVVLGMSAVILLVVLCAMLDLIFLCGIIIQLLFVGVVVLSRVGGTITATDAGVEICVPMTKPKVIPYYKIRDVELDVENRGKTVTGMYKGTLKYAHSIKIVTNEGTYTYSSLLEHRSDPTAFYVTHDALIMSSPFGEIARIIKEYQGAVKTEKAPDIAAQSFG